MPGSFSALAKNFWAWLRIWMLVFVPMWPACMELGNVGD
jgi:hypothetical protein